MVGPTRDSDSNKFSFSVSNSWIELGKHACDLSFVIFGRPNFTTYKKGFFYFKEAPCFFKKDGPKSL